jgi:predicted nucleotidyltransferase
MAYKKVVEIFGEIHYSVDMVNMTNIEDVAKRIGSQINAEAVILFGSYAKGTANENSDVDFLVVAESNLPRFKRSRKLYKLFKPYPFGMDILVYTPAEIEKGRRISQSFVSTVLQEGKTVYAKRRN